MKHTNKSRRLSPLAAAIAVCIFIFASATTAYAADVGGIQRLVQLWIHGEQKEVNVEFDGSGNYELDYTDAEGNVQHRGGGGVAFEPDGSERPLSEEELLDCMTDPEVTYKEDGTVWVYWFDQKIEITDRFEDGVCYLKLEGEGETLYMTIKYQNGYSLNPKGFEDPADFN